MQPSNRFDSVLWMKKFKKIEIELSSKCNAACPGCRRTALIKSDQEFPKKDLSEDLIYEKFQELDLNNTKVKLCGVLGDPLVHPKLKEVTQWFLSRGADVQISTNASLRATSFWAELGALSRVTDRLYLQFAVDGLQDTNHVYRVNTNYEVIARNMTAYAEAGGQGAWNFIEFDHNTHQISEARSIAEKLKIDFFVRRAAKNSVFEWEVDHNKKIKKEYKIVKHTSQAHAEVETYKKIRNNEIKYYDPDSVKCKFHHDSEFFLAADGSVWPCCFLWDEFVSGHSTLSQKANDFGLGKNWNQVHANNFSEIFNHPFYQEIQRLWVQDTPLFLKRCYLSCGSKGKLGNTITKD